MQIGSKLELSWMDRLARWWRKPPPAVVKRAKEIRARELVEAHADKLRPIGFASNQLEAVRDCFTALLSEIADGRTTLEPNQSQLKRAREGE